MDPLSALSVAAAVVQFVDYGTTLVSKGRKLYKSTDGALSENVELEAASSRLQLLARGLQDSLLHGQQGQQGRLTERDQALDTICNGCTDVSKDLITTLKGLTLASDHKHRKWESFKLTLKTVWSEKKMEETAAKLAKLRSELDTHVILSLREQGVSLSVHQDKRFNSLDKNVQSVIDTLLDDRVALHKSLEALSVAVKNENFDTRKAVTGAVADRSEKRVLLSLLESLRFDTMNIRHESITDAHQRTFEWIFKDPESYQKPWSSFCQWLESGTGIYWINGKAGSGKSTLMRFVVEDPRTRAHLKAWAPNGALEIPSFFFWNSGTPDQRSQVGLFRSILYTALRKHMSLIPIVFPEEWESSLENARHDVPISFGFWSLARLKKCFQRLMDQVSENIRFCFIIDGLDEYDGDHDELAIYFSELANSPFVKLCVSSRPLLAFKGAFKEFPGLRLQDLTEDDIQHYVEDKLNANVRMKMLALTTPKEPKSLIETVIFKAEGVFLWVTIVVKSLLNGLRQMDNISTLMKRLEHLPSELEKLYEHMLASIDPFNKAEGSKIFQIHRATRLDFLSIGMLSLALTVDLQTALAPPTLDLEAPQPVLLQSQYFGYSDAEPDLVDRQESLYQSIDAKLQTRCGGLLQIKKLKYGSFTLCSVFFIHRSVMDYIYQKGVWYSLLAHTKDVSNPRFDPNLAMLMSYVLTFKRDLLRAPSFIKNMMRYWYHIADNAYFVDPPNLAVQTLLLDEFDRVATDVYRSEKPAKDGGDEFDPSGHWTALFFPNHWKTTLLYVASAAGLNPYVKLKLPTQHEAGIPLIVFILLQTIEGSNFENLEVLELLLVQGADPNERYMGYTVWQYWVQYIHALKWNSGKLHALKRVCKCMLNRGVDMHVCCIKDGYIWRRLHGTSKEGPSWGSTLVSVLQHTNLKKELEIGRDESMFEEAHSLSTVITDVFNTTEDPHGADELLEHIAMLKAQKGSGSQSGTSAGQRRKKKNRRNGKNSKA